MKKASEDSTVIYKTNLVGNWMTRGKKFCYAFCLSDLMFLLMESDICKIQRMFVAIDIEKHRRQRSLTLDLNFWWLMYLDV